MKKLLSALCVVAAASSHASEYGCKVLLCLANPPSNGGPKGVAQCVDPINQLYRDLRHGRPFPNCDQADGNDGASYARQVFDPYDPCPTPLQPAASGSIVAQGQRNKAGTSNTGWRSDSGSFVLAGRPQASEQQSDYEGSTLGAYSNAGMRACVGKLIGSYTVGNPDSEYTVLVFDKVIWQQPQNPRAIDIYIDRKWYQRVRW
jgi:hypothetical protein